MRTDYILWTKTKAIRHKNITDTDEFMIKLGFSLVAKMQCITKHSKFMLTVPAPSGKRHCMQRWEPGWDVDDQSKPLLREV